MKQGPEPAGPFAIYRMPNTPNLRAVMEQFGLKIASIERIPEGSADFLRATGTFADGARFSAKTAPFRGDAARRAAVLAGQLLAEHKLKVAIDHGADRLTLARQVAIAWVEGRKSRMALSEKLANIAARAHAVPQALEKRADALLPRLEAVERQGNMAFDGLEAHIKDAEAAVAATEAAVRQISNTPFGGSGSSSS